MLLVIVGQFIWHRLSGQPKSATGSNPASPQSVSTPSTVPSSSPVTFAEIVQVESDETMTDLQKDEFRHKHEGKMVEWTVRVRSVSRLWEHKADSDFAVVFDSVDAPDTHGKTGVATFPASYRDDMVDLHSADTIRFRGVLNFLDIGRTVSVRNCQLLERHK